MSILQTCVFIGACIALSSADQQRCTAAAAETSAYLNKFDTFQLTYFNGRGLAEVLRTLFATAGRFPGTGFEDVRLTRDQFDQLKGTGDLAKNLNRVPVLNHNGEVIGQSSSIARYLSNQFGFLGANEAQAAQVDSMCEHIVDIKAAYRKAVPYGSKLTAEEQTEADSIWFDTPATPILEGRKERQLRWFLDQVEVSLDHTGYSVGGRPSLADAYFFNMLGEYAPELDAKGEPFGSIAATGRVMEAYPKLFAVVMTFRASPGMSYYLETRGKMGF